MATEPTEQEMARTGEWVTDCLKAPFTGAAPEHLPFRLQYGGEDLAALAPSWERSWQEAAQPEGARLTGQLADSATGLRLECAAVAYADFPAVDWVLRLRNDGSGDTAILSDILPLDLVLPASSETPCVVHHARGSDAQLNDFEPLTSPVAPGGACRIASAGGRSSNGALPFFNLEFDGWGLLGAIGWTGDWFCEVAREADGAARVRAGMPRTHLKLLPGEEVRSPRILLLYWEGDRLRAHNLWRRLLLAHYCSRPRADAPQAPICSAVWGENLAANQVAKARWFREHDVPLECFWIDAGWHGDAPLREDASVFNTDWWRHVGSWWPNRNTYPQGLGPVGEAVQELGMDFLIWIEAERAHRDAWLAKERPHWLLGPQGDNYLVNLGDPEAREGLTRIVSEVLTEGHLTWYRQDFNIDPAPFWAAADAADRVGMTEIRYIEGLYAFWDALRERHPGLAIDNCSSGGRRIDLETISRSVPLWRSDFQCYPDFDPIGLQGQTLGLAPWVPLSTGCCDAPDWYGLRSALGPGIVFTTNRFEAGPGDYFPADWLRAAMAEVLDLRPFFLGDFYPLTRYAVSDDVWAAWQLDRPDLGEGAVIALRRPHSPYPRLQVPLHGLDAQARYRLWRGAEEGSESSGAELMGKGLVVDLPGTPDSAVIRYRRVG